MRVLLLLPYAWDTAPSQRYRIEQWAPWLRAQGVEFQVSTLLTPAEQTTLYGNANAVRKGQMMVAAAVRRTLELSRLRDFDLIWLHRAALPVGPPILERRLAKSGVPMIFEFDDAIFMPHTSAVNSRFRALKFAGKTGELCKLSRHVVVGNEFLAEYARKHNDHVTVIPTTIDTSVYRACEAHYTNETVVIGWSGSGTTLPHLRTLDRVFQRLAKRVNFRIAVIGVNDYELPGVEVKTSAWKPDTQVASLQRFDIGVMPLPDEEWARGKCACKALEYMAVGVPVVTSPVGVNAEIIRNGVNGLLAATEDEWVAQLERLVMDAGLRRELGAKGRETVVNDFSTSVQAPRVYDLLRQIAGPQLSSKAAVEVAMGGKVSI